MLLRRRHQLNRTEPRPPIDAGTYFDDEQFEILESGAVWDEAAEFLQRDNGV